MSAWIARAEDEGVVAIDAETTRADPLQGELIGLSLAVKPGEACYIPDRPSDRRRTISSTARASRPIRWRKPKRSRCLKPLLEQPGVLKVGHDIKFDMHVLAMRGIRVAPIDDAMLLSYTLDAGATGDDHSLDTLSDTLSRPQAHAA